MKDISEKKCSIVFLDESTVAQGDLNLTVLKKLGSYKGFPHTTKTQTKSRLKKAQVVISNKVILDESTLKESPVKLICVAATGTNNVDLDYCKANGIQVTNCRNYSTTGVAERTLLFIQTLAHRFLEQNQACHWGRWQKEKTFNLRSLPFQEVKGKSLGIVGYGSIGQEVAKLANAFGMKVHIAKIPGRHYTVQDKRKPLKTILKTCDFISLHCPLSDLTHHLINHQTLSLMKKTAFLINLARGPLVHEEALVQTLKKGLIAGYASDVFDQEPLPSTHPFLSKSLKSSIYITPHTAWASLESRRELVKQIETQIKAFKKGLRPPQILEL